MTSVVHSVPRPIATPAKAKSSTGVNMAPPNFCIFCIMAMVPFCIARRCRRAAMYGRTGSLGPMVFPTCPNKYRSYSTHLFEQV